jgi:hypothetical protein
VTQDTTWLDIGCGRNIFPENKKLARQLSDRCECLVGVDPDETIQENPFVHEKAQVPLEMFQSERRFSLVTLRMVAEHIENPDATLRKISELTETGGFVVVYTIHRFSPVSLVSYFTPHRIHHVVKRAIWGCPDERDTFPVAYRMNTKRSLNQCFENAEFSEAHLELLPDCCILFRYPRLNLVELTAWKLLRKLGIQYPEFNMLGVYQKK